MAVAPSLSIFFYPVIATYQCFPILYHAIENTANQNTEKPLYIEQLMNEAEYLMKNYGDRGDSK